MVIKEMVRNELSEAAPVPYSFIYCLLTNVQYYLIKNYIVLLEFVGRSRINVETNTSQMQIDLRQ